jgi:DNA-binding response OmpR family regulator
MSLTSAPLVLVVEDQEDTRFLLRTILEIQGFRVAEAADGDAGVRTAEELRPDLVLMDGSLPLMDGLAATRRIREREDGHRVPLIFLSGHAAPASQTAAFTVGCDDYIVKPFEIKKLVRILEHHLHQDRPRITRQYKHRGGSA